MSLLLLLLLPCGSQVLNRAAFAQRMLEYQETRQRHYYFMTLNNSEVGGIHV